MVRSPRRAAAATPATPMARSTSLRFSIAALLLPGRGRLAAGLQAVLVAVQDFLPDGFLHLCTGSVTVGTVTFCNGFVQRINDGGFRPPVELLHEARLFL